MGQAGPPGKDHLAKGVHAALIIRGTGMRPGEVFTLQWENIYLNGKPFEPYMLRHTALTQLAQAGVDVFTLARIAGHSSIPITRRYVHPQADAVERAFAPFGSTNISSRTAGEIPR